MKTKKTKNYKWLKRLWMLIGYIYMPIYFCSWILHKIARLLLAIAYIGLLEFNRAKHILKNLLWLDGKPIK